MKRTIAKGRSVKQRLRTQRTVQRASRVQRGRTTVASSVAPASSFARWTTTDPWDGQRLGTGLVDTSQLACECGECRGCQQRLG